MTECDFLPLEKGPPTWARPAFNLLRVAAGVVGVLLVSVGGVAVSRLHLAQAPGTGQPIGEGDSFSISPGFPLPLQFGSGPRPEPDLVAVGTTEKPQPEQEADAKRNRAKLKKAEAKLKKAKAELKEAKAELKEAESELKNAKNKREKAKATDRELASAQWYVDHAEWNVAFRQKEVDHAEWNVAFGQKEVAIAQHAYTELLLAGRELITGASLYQFFRNSGWVPEQLPAPQQLVMTSEILPKLRYPEDAIRLLCETVSTRFKNYLRGLLDKEKQPHMICFPTAGTGESRLAQEALPLLQEHVDHPELRALLRNSSVAVHVTFGGDSKFDSWDLENGPEAALSVRALSSYFGVEIAVLRSLGRIELPTALDCILLDFRWRRSLAQDSMVAFYLAIDDAGQTLLDVDDAKADRDFLRFIFNAVGSWLLGPRRSVFPITLITGTPEKAIYRILSMYSNHPWVSLPVPSCH